MIDLSDLRWQAKRVGGASEPDLTAVLAQLEAGLAKLGPVPGTGLRLGVVYVYSPREADRPPEGGRVVFKQQATEVRRPCWSCYKACTHCQASTGSRGGLGRDNPIASDLLELARGDAFDWAVVVSSDLGLIPVVRYLQSHGRKIIHGRFPPVAVDLTKECWASIDLIGASP